MSDGIIVTVTAGATISDNEQIVAEKLNALGSPTIALTGTLNTSGISDNAVTGGKIAVNTIVNSNIKSDAGIEFTKMEAAAEGYVIAGNADNLPSPQQVAGDLLLSSATSVDMILTETVNVGDWLRWVAAPAVDTHVGKVVKVTSLGAGVTRVFLSMLTGAPNTVGTDAVIKRQKTTVTLSSSTSTIDFGEGARATQGSYGFDVVSASIGGTGPAYTVTVVGENFTGALSETSALSIAGSSYSVISALESVGSTSPVGATGLFSNSPDVIVAANNSQQSFYLDGEAVVAGPTATLGRVLTSAGPNRLAEWQPTTAVTPICRGGARPCFGTNFVIGNSYSLTGHASAWSVLGWEQSGSDCFIHLYHPSYNNALNTTSGDIVGDPVSGEVIIITPSYAGSASFMPNTASVANDLIPRYVPMRVVSVVESTAIGTGTKRTRKVKLVRLSDNTGVTWNGSSTTDSVKGFACRQAFAITGASVFRAPICNTDGTTAIDPSQATAAGGSLACATGSSGYAVIFDTAAADTSYSANITTSSLYDFSLANGYPGGVALNDNKYGVFPNIQYKGLGRFSFNCSYPYNHSTYDPKGIDITVYGS